MVRAFLCDNDFESVIFSVHYATYLVYFFLKYLTAIYIVFALMTRQKTRHCCSKTRRCCCCLLLHKFMRWVITLVLGREEGVVERFKDYYRNDELDENGLPALYIRNKKLEPYEVNLLAVLLITFGLIIAVTAFDLFLFDVTYTCTDNPDIYCFVTDSLNGSESDLNITNERITDCQYWNSESISGRFTFTCFRSAYNTEATLAAVGGLITLFQYTVKVTTEIFITSFKKLITSECFKRNNMIFIIKTIRILIGFFVFLLEMFSGLVFSRAFLSLLKQEQNSFTIFVSRFY